MEQEYGSLQSPSELGLTAFGQKADHTHRVLKDLVRAPSLSSSRALPLPSLQSLALSVASVVLLGLWSNGVPFVGYFYASISGGCVLHER